MTCAIGECGALFEISVASFLFSYLSLHEKFMVNAVHPASSKVGFFHLLNHLLIVKRQQLESSRACMCVSIF